LKEKHRYILVRAWRALPEPERQTFERSFYSSMLAVLGELGYSEAHPKLIKFLDDSHFIIKCTLEGKESTLLSLSMMKKVGGEDAFFYTLRSSGTLRALQKYYSSISGEPHTASAGSESQKQ